VITRSLAAFAGLALALCWAGSAQAHPMQLQQTAQERQYLNYLGSLALKDGLYEPKADQSRARAESARQNAYYRTHPLHQWIDASGKQHVVYAHPGDEITIVDLQVKPSVQAMVSARRAYREQYRKTYGVLAYWQAFEPKMYAHYLAHRSDVQSHHRVHHVVEVDPDQLCGIFDVNGNECTDGFSSDAGDTAAAATPNLEWQTNIYGLPYLPTGGEGCTATNGNLGHVIAESTIACGFLPDLTSNIISTISNDDEASLNGNEFVDVCGDDDSYCQNPNNVNVDQFCTEYAGLDFNDIDAECQGFDTTNPWGSSDPIALFNVVTITNGSCWAGSPWQRPSPPYNWINQYYWSPGSPSSQSWVLQCVTPASENLSYGPTMAGPYQSAGLTYYEQDFAFYFNGSFLSPVTTQIGGNQGHVGHVYSSTYLSGSNANNYLDPFVWQNYALGKITSPCFPAAVNNCVLGGGINIGIDPNVFG
jgi:hypothetical protein